MPKKLTFDNLPFRIDEAKNAMRACKDTRLKERYQCIYLLLSGKSRKEVAQIIGRGLDTVGLYVQTYYDHGLAGLQMNHSPGRPKLLSSEQEQQLYKTIMNQTPTDVGFPANMNWTAPLVRDWIMRTFNIKYSERGARELLYRLGFSYTKPTYTLAKADPAKQEAFRKVFDDTKKN